MKRAQRLWIAALFFCLMSCSETLGPNEKKAAKEPQNQAAKQPLAQSQITEIPTKAITIDGLIESLPLAPGGLRFQFNQSNQPNFQYHKPIGDAKFGPDGSLYLSFPEKHSVVRMTPPSWHLEFFGSEQEGGRDQPISYPVNFSFWNDAIQVANTKKGQVMVFNRQFDLETFHQVHIQDPIAGPDQQFLIRSDSMPAKFFRADKNNKIRSQYMVPANPSQPKQDRLLHFDIQSNWDIVAINFAGTDLYHLQKNGQFRRHFQLIYANDLVQGTLTVSDFQKHGDAYWILYKLNQNGIDRIILAAITFDGISRYLWEIPYLVDGFHLTHQTLVLFDRKEGKAQVWRR